MSNKEARKLRHLCKLLELVLNSRAEPFKLMMLASLPSFARTFRVVDGELGIKVIIRRTGDGGDNPGKVCDELTAAIWSVENACRQFPAATLFEIMALQSQKMICKIIHSHLPRTLQNTTLRLLSFVSWYCNCQVSATEGPAPPRLQALSFLLQEPLSAVSHLLREHHYHVYWNYACRLGHLKRKSAAPGGFHWPERDAYLAINKNYTESRVLVTIHMGDFFGAFRFIADSLGQTRSVISLQRDGHSEGIQNLSQVHKKHHQIFVHGEHNPLQIVRALRSGGQTVTALFDLGAGFGETTSVIFFGHQALFVRGPAELAISGRARIYPFVCFSEAGSNQIDMAPPFTPEIMHGENLQAAVSRVTQTLVSMAERWIKQRPAQWKYLDKLPSYLVIDNAVCRDADAGQAEVCHAQ